jgi:hypothetical protein
MNQVCRTLPKSVLIISTLMLMLVSFYSQAEYFSEYDKWYNSGVGYKKSKQYRRASNMFSRAQSVVNRMERNCPKSRRKRRSCIQGLCRAKFFLSWNNTVTQYYLKNTKAVAKGYRLSAAAYYSSSRAGTFICPGVPQKLGMTSLYKAASGSLRSGNPSGYQFYYGALGQLERRFKIGSRYTSKLRKGGVQSTRGRQNTRGRQSSRGRQNTRGRQDTRGSRQQNDRRGNQRNGQRNDQRNTQGSGQWVDPDSKSQNSGRGNNRSSGNDQRGPDKGYDDGGQY